MALNLRAALNRHLLTNLRRQFSSKMHRGDHQSCSPSELYELSILRRELQPQYQQTMRNREIAGNSSEKVDAERKMFTKYSKGTSLRRGAFLSSVKPAESLGSYRSFSYDKDSDECKAKKAPASKKCQKFDICDCEPSKDTSCTKMPLFPKCNKRLAPYPSFSEACYEEPYNKPSECKLCPWKPMDNPNPTFKHKTRGYHSATNLNQNFKPYKKSTLLEKKPLERMLLRLLSDKASNRKPQSDEVLQEKRIRIQSLDPICSRTLAGGTEPVNSYLHQPTYKKKSPGKKAELTESHDHSTCRCSQCTRIAYSGEATFLSIPFIELPNFYAYATKEPEREQKRRTCVKLPFKPCNFDRSEDSRPRAKRCPKLPHRFHRKVGDCPPDPDAKKTCLGYLMKQGKDGCPVVDRSKCGEDQGPTCPKKEIRSQICPTEPLIKKIGYQPLKKRGGKTEEGSGKKAEPLSRDDALILLAERKVEIGGVPVVTPAAAHVETPDLRVHIETSRVY